MDRLVDLALAGTGHTRDQFDPASNPASMLVGQIPTLSPARQILLAAGANAVYDRAGLQPGAAEPLPTAPEENQPECTPRASQLLRELLDDDQHSLLNEALSRLADSGQRLPYTLIIPALNTATNGTIANSLVHSVIGQRGRWLAALHPAWQQVIQEATADHRPLLLAEAERIWQEGSEDERVGVLLELNQEQPALAREWLSATWKKEKVEFRTWAMRIFIHTASLDDEPFLQQASTDRSETIRTAAKLLLYRLPESQASQAMLARATSLLHVTSSKAGFATRLLGQQQKYTLEVTLPKTDDTAWGKALLHDVPAKKQGQRAWWLRETLAVIDPDNWSTRFNLPPATLINLASEHEFGKQLIEAWGLGANLHSNVEWARALWSFWLNSSNKTDLPDADQAALFALLPAAEQDQIALTILRARNPNLTYWQLVNEALSLPWGRAITEAYLQVIRQQVQRASPKEYRADEWVQTLKSAGAAIAPADFPQALVNWPIPHGESWQIISWREELDQFTAQIELRARLEKELPQ